MNATAPSSSMEQTCYIEIDHVAEIHYHYLHLNIIRAMLRPFLHPNRDENRPIEYLSLRSKVRSRAKACISAVVDFMRSLGSNDREILWPAWSATVFSSINFQILLMAISSLDLEESAYYWEYLHRLRRDMRLQADALPHLRLGLLRIDSIFWKGLDAVFRLDEHIRQAYFETTGRVSSGGDSDIPRGFS